MDRYEVRIKFEGLIGPERYRSFVSTIQSVDRESGRLKFKQEREWEIFCEKHSFSTRTFSEIWDLFQYCILHDQEFENDTVPIVYGTKSRVAGEKLRHIEENYPNANTVFYGPCWNEKPKQRRSYIARSVEMHWPMKLESSNRQQPARSGLWTKTHWHSFLASVAGVMNCRKINASMG